MTSENFLKKIRQEKGLKQSDLARRAGVSRQLLWGYENGKFGVSSQILSKLAGALSVSPSYIVTGKTSSESLNSTEKKRMLEAIKTTSEFYKDHNFDQETVLKIAMEVYNFTTNFNDLKKEIGNNGFNKSLNDKIISGLAARCFIDSSSSDT